MSVNSIADVRPDSVQTPVAMWKRALLVGAIPLVATLGSAPACAQSNPGATTAAAPAPSPVPAETSTGDIIVTAQRRAERLQDVPITVQNLTATQLSDANVVNLSGIAKLTPALRFDDQGPFVQPTIRGIGSAIVTSGAGSNVGIYIDGFYSPNPIASDFQLLDVTNVEVLKGPQGTLFGRNTTGGAILVTTAKPSHDTSAVFDAQYGSFNALDVQAYATTGLTRNIAFDIGAEYAHGDGYIHNIVTGSSTDGTYHNLTVRAGLLVDFTPDVSLLLRYTHQDHSDPYPELNTIGVIGGQPITQSAFFPGAIIATQPGTVSIADKVASTAINNIYQATLNADLGFAKLTSYTQFRDEKDDFVQNFNGAVPNFLDGNVPIHDQTISQEFLLNSRTGGRLQWTTGAFFFDYRDTFAAYISALGAPYFQAAGSHSDTRSYAAFADGTYQLFDKLFVTVGARYSHDQILNPYFQSFTSTPPLARQYAPEMNADRVTPRVVLRYQLDAQSNVYASFTEGYKAGLYNLGGASTAPIKPETLNAFEVGYKHANKRFSLDLAGFYYNYSNLQVSSYGITNGVPVGYILNAANARIYGFEAQTHFNVTPDFSIDASGSYLNAKYKQFNGDPHYYSCFGASPPPNVTAAAFNNACFGGGLPNALVAYPVNGTGLDMQRAPAFTATVAARYGFDLAKGRMVLSSNVYYTSKFYFDSADQLSQGGYATVGLRGEWTSPSGRLTLAVHGDNLTGKRYLTQGLLENNSAAESWSPPATVAGEIRVKFR